jgi:AcrR family transcriptional regulator
VVNEGRLSRRQIAAADTRREILAAARRLFAANGYTNTSLQHIAEEAGVAMQTIYSSVGPKSAVVLALNDLIDEEAGVAQLGAEVMAATKPAEMIAKSVHLTRRLNERCGDLIATVLSAAPSEPEAAAALADGMRRHERGAGAMAARLAALDALRDDMTAEKAAAAVAMMTSPASWRQLSQGAGWSYDEAETWLTASLTQLILRRRR